MKAEGGGMKAEGLNDRAAERQSDGAAEGWKVGRGTGNRMGATRWFLFSGSSLVTHHLSLAAASLGAAGTARPFSEM